MFALQEEEGLERNLPCSPREKWLPKNLAAYPDLLRDMFDWLADHPRTGDKFVEAMNGSGGTVSMFMLAMYKEPDHRRYPWSMLDDPYYVRTITGKMANWLNGKGSRHAKSFRSAQLLRAYKSEQ